MNPCAYLSKWSPYAPANKTVSSAVTAISTANQCIKWAPAGGSIFRTVLILTRDNAIPRMLWRHDQFVHKYFIHPFTHFYFTFHTRCTLSCKKKQCYFSFLRTFFFRKHQSCVAKFITEWQTGGATTKKTPQKYLCSKQTTKKKKNSIIH